MKICSQKEVVASTYIPWFKPFFNLSVKQNNSKIYNDNKVQRIEKTYKSKGVNNGKDCKTGGWYC